MMEKRPLLITVLAWILIAGGLFFLIMKPLTWSQLSLQQNLWSVGAKMGSLVCGIGLLKMRKWAVLLYFVLFAMNTVLLCFSFNGELTRLYRQPSNLALLFFVPLVVALITLTHWNKMTWQKARLDATAPDQT